MDTDKNNEREGEMSDQEGEILDPDLSEVGSSLVSRSRNLNTASDDPQKLYNLFAKEGDFADEGHGINATRDNENYDEYDVLLGSQGRVSFGPMARQTLADQGKLGFETDDRVVEESLCSKFQTDCEAVLNSVSIANTDLEATINNLFDAYFPDFSAEAMVGEEAVQPNDTVYNPEAMSALGREMNYAASMPLYDDEDNSLQSSLDTSSASLILRQPSNRQSCEAIRDEYLTKLKEKIESQNTASVTVLEDSSSSMDQEEFVLPPVTPPKHPPRKVGDIVNGWELRESRTQKGRRYWMNITIPDPQFQEPYWVDEHPDWDPSQLIGRDLRKQATPMKPAVVSSVAPMASGIAGALSREEQRRALFEQIQQRVVDDEYGNNARYNSNEKESMKFQNKNELDHLVVPYGAPCLVFRTGNKRRYLTDLLLRYGCDEFLCKGDSFGPEVCVKLGIPIDDELKLLPRFPGKKVSLVSTFTSRAKLIGHILVGLKNERDQKLNTLVKAKIPNPILKAINEIISFKTKGKVTVQDTPNAIGEKMISIVSSKGEANVVVDDEDEDSSSSSKGGRSKILDPDFAFLDKCVTSVETAIREVLVDTIKGKKPATSLSSESLRDLDYLHIVIEGVRNAKGNMDRECLTIPNRLILKYIRVLSITNDGAAASADALRTNKLGLTQLSSVDTGLTNNLVENIAMLLSPEVTQPSVASSLSSLSSSLSSLSSLSSSLTSSIGSLTGQAGAKYKDTATNAPIDETRVNTYLTAVRTRIQQIFGQNGLMGLLQMPNYNEMCEQNNARFEALFSFLDSSPSEIISAVPEDPLQSHDVFTSNTNYECLSRIEVITKTSVCNKTMLLSLCSTLEYYRLDRGAFCNEGNFDVVCHDIKKNATRVESCVRVLNEHIAMALYLTKKIDQGTLDSMLSDPSLLCRINTQQVDELFTNGPPIDIIFFIRFVCNHFAEGVDDITAFDEHTQWWLNGSKGENPTKDFVERINTDIENLFGDNHIDVVKGCGLPEPLELCLKHVLSLNYERVQVLYRKKCVHVFDLSRDEYIMGKNVSRQVVQGVTFKIDSFTYDKYDKCMASICDLKYAQFGYPEIETGADKLDANPQNVSSNLALKSSSIVEDDMYYVVPNGSLKLTLDFVTKLRVARDIVLDGKVKIPFNRFGEILEDAAGSLTTALRSLDQTFRVLQLNGETDHICGEIINQVGDFVDLIEESSKRFNRAKGKDRKDIAEEIVERLSVVSMIMVKSISTNVDMFFGVQTSADPRSDLDFLKSVDFFLLELVRSEIIKLPSSSFSFSLAKEVITDAQLNEIKVEAEPPPPPASSSSSSSASSRGRSSRNSGGMNGGDKNDERLKAIEALNSEYGARTVVDYLGNYYYKKIETQEEYDEYMKFFTFTVEIPNYSESKPIVPFTQNPMLNEFKNAIPNSLVSFGGYNKTHRKKNKNRNKSRKVRKTKRQNKRSNKGTKKHKKIIKHKKSRSNI